jgi:hypothetical protein
VLGDPGESQRLPCRGEDLLVTREQLEQELTGVGRSVDDVGCVVPLAEGLGGAGELVAGGGCAEALVQRWGFHCHVIRLQIRLSVAHRGSCRRFVGLETEKPSTSRCRF